MVGLDHMFDASVSDRWPLQKEAVRFYGDPSYRAVGDKANAAWERDNIVLIKAAEIPFKVYFAGKQISGIRVHKKVRDSLLRVFNRIWEAAGKSQKTIDAWGVSSYAGAYLYRMKIGGTTLSMHAYGCAIDLDPARNAFHDQTPNFATGPQHAVVKAFEAEGWEWGGRWSGRSKDGMHFQAAHV